MGKIYNLSPVLMNLVDCQTQTYYPMQEHFNDNIVTVNSQLYCAEALTFFILEQQHIKCNNE